MNLHNWQNAIFTGLWLTHLKQNLDLTTKTYLWYDMACDFSIWLERFNWFTPNCEGGNPVCIDQPFIKSSDSDLALSPSYKL